jgi:hypothetical protein
MDSKTLATIMVVFVCVMLFPIFIGIIGGIFGVIGGVVGGLFGFIGWIFGAIFGAIGALFGAFFGLFGWMFGDHWHWPGGWFHRDFFTVLALVLFIVLISRARTPRRTGK